MFWTVHYSSTQPYYKFHVKSSLLDFTWELVGPLVYGFSVYGQAERMSLVLLCVVVDGIRVPACGSLAMLFVPLLQWLTHFSNVGVVAVGLSTLESVGQMIAR